MGTRVTSLRTTDELIEEVDELVRMESEQIGLPVDRNSYINRAIREDVKRRRPVLEAAGRVANDNAKGAA